MYLSKDVIELLQFFKRFKVDYLLVGGVAVNFHGYVRTTQDVDFLLFPSEENSTRVIRALNMFGFGEAGLSASFFSKPGTAIHLGVEPNRIDLLTHLKDISNRQLFENMIKVTIDGHTFNMISLDDLCEAKSKSTRFKDLADAEELLKIRKARSKL